VFYVLLKLAYVVTATIMSSGDDETRAPGGSAGVSTVRNKLNNSIVNVVILTCPLIFVKQIKTCLLCTNQEIHQEPQVRSKDAINHMDNVSDIIANNITN